MKSHRNELGINIVIKVVVVGGGDIEKCFFFTPRTAMSPCGSWKIESLAGGHLLSSGSRPSQMEREEEGEESMPRWLEVLVKMALKVSSREYSNPNCWQKKKKIPSR